MPKLEIAKRKLLSHYVHSTVKILKFIIDVYKFLEHFIYVDFTKNSRKMTKCMHEENRILQIPENSYTALYTALLVKFLGH